MDTEPDKSQWKQRTETLYGPERMERLAAAHVLVVGLGGVGAYALEMLCRAGVGRFTIIDADTVSVSNINRQLPALHSTIGQPKATLLAERMQDINPQIVIDARIQFVTPDNIPSLISNISPDFVVDAIDTVRSKCSLIEECLTNNIPIVSAMGAGAKTDISRIRCTDISKTTQCALAKAVRQTLRQEGFGHHRLPVVFSDEPVQRHAIVPVSGEPGKRSTTGTVSYLTATFGNYLAWYVLENL